MAGMRLGSKAWGGRPTDGYMGRVKTFLAILVAMLMFATLGVLFAGLFGLVRGGGDPKRSNKLMQLAGDPAGGGAAAVRAADVAAAVLTGGLTALRPLHMVRRLYCRCEQAGNPPRRRATFLEATRSPS